MTVLTEGTYPAEYLVSEGNGTISREVVGLASGQNLSAGTVIGKAADGTYKALARRALEGAASKVSGDGNGTLSAVTLGASALIGDYILTCTAADTDAGTFSVVAPDGTVLAPLTVAVAYTSAHINLTIADGATDWGEGAVVKVAVTEASGALANDQVAAGILFDNVDASLGAKKAVITARMAEVNGYALTWPALMTATNKAEALTALAALDIVVR
jgi:hypothetical protein